MIFEIEKLLNGNEKWSKYKDLYNYIRSSHYHLLRIKGKTDKEILFNIENLVSLLNGIIKISKKEIDIYPFIGNWEKELHLVAGMDLRMAFEFKNEILEKLRAWLFPPNFTESTTYYKKFLDTKYNYPLKIFSLNYDMCIESNVKGENIILERGFDENRIWNYRRYDSGGDIEVNYYLYKLHGSLDWIRDNTKRLTFSDNIGAIDTEDLEIIFGVQNKLQSYDPYLFYFYAFREACSEAELIVCSGYGFLDDHINDNLENAFKDDKHKKLLVNIYENDFKEDEYKQRMAERLNISINNIVICNEKAKDFFENKMNINFFSSLFANDKQEEQILP